MIQRLLFNFRLLFFLTYYSTSACAQIETIAVNTNEEIVGNSVKKVGDHLIYATKSSPYSKIRDVDLTNGSTSIIDSNVLRLDNFAYSDDGIFYTSLTSTGSWTDGEFFLNYYDPQGNQLTPILIGIQSSSVPNDYEPRDATLCNDRYYLNAYYNNEYCIWESDGTTAGTQIIYQSSDPIVSINELNDTLFIVTENSNEYTFFHYTAGGVVQQYAVQSTVNFISNFKILGKHNGHFYFKSTDSSNASSIHRIDFQTPPEFFVTGSFVKMSFSGNRFILFSGDSVFSGPMSNPQQFAPIPAIQDLQSPSLLTDTYFGDGYFRIRSIENGVEFVHINTNDSLELIQTNVIGAGSGVPVNVDGFVHSNTSTSTKFFTDDAGNTYTVLTNGNDGNYYMYQLNGSVEQSLFKIDHPEDVTDIFVSDGYIYWSEIRNNDFSIKRRSLSAPMETQPSQIAESETWFRQFVAVDLPVWDPYQVTMYLKDAKLNQDGSAIVSLSLGVILQNCQFHSSDLDSTMYLNGSDVIVKYDKFGKFQWANGIGQKYGLWLKDNQFAVRENGNVVVCGRFYHEAYFDSDTILNPNSETFTFLAELDANTGQIIWRKFIFQDIYYDTFEPEGMVIDENDNLYIAASFYGSGVSIDGEYISSQSQVNKTNALVKFDPTGNVIWARTSATPFTEYFGETSTLNYSEEFQTIYLVQSQGNSVVWSSCEFHDWKYYIQEWDVDGNKKSGIEIVGSDVGSLTVSTRTEDNQFFGMGYFRGKLAIDNYDVESTLGANCHNDEGFQVLFDGELNKIVSARTTSNNAFYPLDIDRNLGFIYVLGTSSSHDLLILKYATDGSYVGYKPLNQILDPNDYDKSEARFDVSGEFILVEGKNFHPDTNLNVRPFVNIFQSVSILKTNNSGWIDDDSWLQDSPYVYDEIDELLIYPNPVSDELNVYFPGTEVEYDTYQVVDMSGRVIVHGDLTEIQLQTIQLPEMRRGVYLINFMGESGTATEQLMKL